MNEITQSIVNELRRRNDDATTINIVCDFVGALTNIETGRCDDATAQLFCDSLLRAVGA